MNALSENNQNPKTLWNTIKTLANKNSKTTNITEIHVDNDLSVTEPKQIADAFNTFFNNIGTQVADALPATNITPEYLSPLRIPLLKFIPFQLKKYLIYFPP